MEINRGRLLKIFRMPEGGLEARKFIDALDQSGDMIKVELEGENILSLDRSECEEVAEIAKESLKEEEDFIDSINFAMREWAIHNRTKVLAMARKALEEAKPGATQAVILWPLCPPDSIDTNILINYLKAYGVQ